MDSGADLWTGDELKRQLELRMAEMLLRAAITLEKESREDYAGMANPSPHKKPAPKGSFPAVRTGHLRDGIIHQPTSLAAIVADGLKIKVGYRAAAFYGIALGNRGWKWLADTLADHESAIRAELGGVAGGINVGSNP
jgi:hypothetical protein